MRKREFYKKFDEGTRIKLAIFRKYVQEWLSVFLTRSKSGIRPVNTIQIYDFFAGPGKDAEGNFGSPLIILEELKAYCSKRAELKGDVSVRMIFNDNEADYIEKLKKVIGETACGKGCCTAEFTSLPFAEALERSLPNMNSSTIANLVIMDQFGVKEVTPNVVRRLAACQKTDILFFVSTAFIHRFVETQEIGSRFDLNVEDQKNLEYNVIHRHLCNYYRKQIDDASFHLAPFSIKKGSNIYGVIFGTKHILGLEKFLRVCWELDSNTGEANYNIDQDALYHGQLSLFEDSNKFKKVDLFERELLEYLLAEGPDNLALNTFCLSKGFSVAKAREVLLDLQKRGELKVWDIANNTPARKGSFYLGWVNCGKGIGRVRFSAEKTP